MPNMKTNALISETGRAPGRRFLTLTFGIMLFSLMVSCQEDGPFVEVNGHKITEADLEKENGAGYQRARGEYEARIQELLHDMAVRRMFELEAKESKQTVDEYVKGLISAAPVPGNQEVEQTYKSLKAGGQIQGSLADMRGRIMQFLMQENQRQVMSQKVAELKKKYGYKTSVARTEVKVDGEPTRGGTASAPVTIVEFSDFECPFCRRAQATTSALRAKYGDKIRWVFKDFPLNFHANAMAAHIAASCVHQQDAQKYWDYFDHLFSGQKDVLKEASLVSGAQKLGIDMKKFEECRNDPAVRQEIEADIAEGQEIGVNGTPAFFINGRMLSGALPQSEFESVLEEEL